MQKIINWLRGKKRSGTLDTIAEDVAGKIPLPQEPMAQTETIDINDKRLLEWLGITPDEINVRGINALKEATVYACIRILAGAVGKLPIKIYKDEGNGKNAAQHEIGPLLKLRPNEYMSAIDFWECMEIQKNIHGNAFAYIDCHRRGPMRGKIKGLYPIDSTLVKIYVDTKGEHSNQKLWYVVTVNNEERKLHPSEILHFKGFSPDGLQGVSPIQYLRTTIESAAGGSEYLNKFYQSGMTTKGIVHYNGDLDPKAEENFKLKFERMANGIKNAHRISLLPYGYQFQPIKMSMVDAQFLETHQLSIRQIAAAFGVKNHQLNDLSRATHTNISEQQREFYIDTLMETLTKYEQETIYKLFTPAEIIAGFYLRFNVDAMLRGDPNARINALTNAIQKSLYTINEARALEDKPPLPGGDVLWGNGNLKPLAGAGIN
ncbi:MAG: phage portal protein [Defluviitaleaceae bacterium]|nr:phage portal protein [Defluviitaleaceae bacterium]